MTRFWTHRRNLLLLSGLLVLPLTGCVSYTPHEVPAISANRVPRELLATPRSDMLTISMARMRQDPPSVYQLGPGDILGIYIENILGSADEPPPVHFDEYGDRPPAIGYPVPVREDGTLDLPLVKPLKVEGLSLAQATEMIRKAYTVDNRIFAEGRDRVIVTMMRPRQYRILVVREEAGGADGINKRGTGFAVDLPAYENDLLHALNETGGLPGLDAKNEVIVYQGGFDDGVERDKLMAHLSAGRDPCSAHLPPPDDPNMLRVPIRYYPNNPPEFTQDDIILESGDIVFIESREREKFYTGGVLGGGEHLLPRDYDLDILGAIALAGGPVGTGAVIPNMSGGGGRGGGGYSGLAPSRAIVIRKTADGGQIPIRVDLNKALSDPSQRILIQPEDFIVVQYTFLEEVYNTALSVVRFNFLFNAGGSSF